MTQIIGAEIPNPGAPLQICFAISSGESLILKPSEAADKLRAHCAVSVNRVPTNHWSFSSTRTRFAPFSAADTAAASLAMPALTTMTSKRPDTAAFTE